MDYDLTPESIEKYDKKTLEKICKLQKLKVSGNKPELQSRILESLGHAPLTPEQIKSKTRTRKSPTKTAGALEPEGGARPEQSTGGVDCSPAQLYKYDKKTLEAICKLHKLKVSGKKEELQNRILIATGQIQDVKEDVKEDVRGGGGGKESVPKSVPKSVSKSKKSPAKKKGGSPSSCPVIQRLEEKSHIYNISRNRWNNYEHLESRLVFQPVDKKVYGVQSDSGDVVELTTRDIELCKKYKFDYVLPMNLSKSDTGGELEKELEKQLIKEIEGEEEIEELERINESDDDLEDLEDLEEVGGAE